MLVIGLFSITRYLKDVSLRCGERVRASDIALHRRFVLLLLSWVRVYRGVPSDRREEVLFSFVSQLAAVVPLGHYSIEESPTGGEV